MSLNIPTETIPRSSSMTSIVMDNYIDGSKTSRVLQPSQSLDEIPATKLARILKTRSPEAIRRRFLLEIAKYFAFLFLFTFGTNSSKCKLTFSDPCSKG